MAGVGVVPSKQELFLITGQIFLVSGPETLLAESVVFETHLVRPEPGTFFDLPG